MADYRCVPLEQIKPGVVLQWVGAPVVVLSDPFLIKQGNGEKIAHARCAYLRRATAAMAGWCKQPGEVVPRFKVQDQLPWSEPLTDEEEALAMRLLLTDA